MTTNERMAFYQRYSAWGVDATVTTVDEVDYLTIPADHFFNMMRSLELLQMIQLRQSEPTSVTSFFSLL